MFQTVDNSSFTSDNFSFQPNFGRRREDLTNSHEFDRLETTSKLPDEESKDYGIPQDTEWLKEQPDFLYGETSTQ